MTDFNLELESALNWAFFFDIKKPSKEGDNSNTSDDFYSPSNKVNKTSVSGRPAVAAPAQLGLLF